MSTSRSNPNDETREDGGAAADPLRPSDHIDSADAAVTSPALGVMGWLRWAWRLLTSMRTALVLLLILAIAAIPGSIFPQRTADPNGVLQYERTNPDLFPFLDGIQLFDVYTSVWFSAIYLLLFVSLVGCILPRIKHHFKAVRSRPPRTPVRLSRLEHYRDDLFEVPGTADAEAERAVDVATAQLRSSGYRVERYDGRGAFSVSAERGYLRETGNILFHVALVGVLVSVGVGGGFAYTGQTVMIEGTTFVNQVVDYTSLNKGRFVDDEALEPYALTLKSFDVTYQPYGTTASGQAGDFSANMLVRDSDGKTHDGSIRVNHPLVVGGERVYLLGNGYAPKLTVRDANGRVVFSQKVPFLPQDNNLTSLGVVKVTDGLKEQLAFQGFFYPTRATNAQGAFTSMYPALEAPVMTLDVYKGDLGINKGAPKNVYELDTSTLTKIAGRTTERKALELAPGQTAQLPDGLGSVTFDDVSPNKPLAPSKDQSIDYSKSVSRFVSLQLHAEPAAPWILSFAILAMGGLVLALFVPRRRVWVKATPKDDRVLMEYAGLARGEDPQLASAVRSIAEKHQTALADETKVD